MTDEADKLRGRAKSARRLAAGTTDAIALRELSKYADECEAQANVLDRTLLPDPHSGRLS